MPTASFAGSTANGSSVLSPPGPSMDEFAAFHGMVCRPASSVRCIEYFDGCALFASQEDYSLSKDHDHLTSFDYLRTPIKLNLFSYYTLVIFSCTGLLTFLGKTKRTLICEENVTFSQDQIMVDASDDGDRPVVQSKSLNSIPGAKPLVIPSKAIDYLMKRSQSLATVPDPTTKEGDGLVPSLPPQVRLIRRFEFEFGNLLSVMMCHFVCSSGRKYLVEVYDFHHKESFLTRTISFVFSAARGLLRILQERPAFTTTSIKQS
mmetsp:Transcript_129955/g.363757  ORF Transcript_129955/g.363757 Transcript_129955/m.363757 type:complete len:262 (-) Transcript_129955:104-889(-)